MYHAAFVQRTVDGLKPVQGVKAIGLVPAVVNLRLYTVARMRYNHAGKEY